MGVIGWVIVIVIVCIVIGIVIGSSDELSESLSATPFEKSKEDKEYYRKIYRTSCGKNNRLAYA